MRAVGVAGEGFDTGIIIELHSSIKYRCITLLCGCGFVFMMLLCLVLADFGLAKMKQREFSVMKSVVGTMLYWW